MLYLLKKSEFFLFQIKFILRLYAEFQHIQFYL